MLPKEWLFIIPDHGNNHILYAPLHRTAFRITQQATKDITPILNGDVPKNRFQSDIKDLLKSKKLLELPSHTKKSESKSNKIFLSITNKCNLRCIYCYANAGIDKSSMSYDIAKKVIDYQLESILSSNDETISVTFHGGGEALVELGLLKEIVSYINEVALKHHIKPVLNCVTNGTLITNEVAKWLSTNFNRLTISLDGIRDVQDKQRPYLSGFSSFHKVLDGINNLIKNKVEFSIRATITKFGVEKMGKFVKFAKENIFPNKGYIQFEPVSLAGRAKGFDEFAIDPETFLANYVNARQIGKKVGINVECSMDTFGFTKKRFCGASQASIQCFTPEGILSGCTRVTKNTDDGSSLFFYGKITDSQLHIDPNAKEKIITFGNKYESECYSCYARWNCQGGCPMTRYDGAEHLLPICYVTKSLLLSDLKNALTC